MTSEGKNNMSIAATAAEAARVEFNKEPTTIVVPHLLSKLMQYKGIEKVLAELGLKCSSTKRCLYKNNKVMKKKTR
jgi:hypothetical protein